MINVTRFKNTYRQAIFLSVLSILVLSVLAGADIGKNHENQGSGTSEDPFIVPKTDSLIKIDGELDEEAWEKALLLEISTEVWPLINEPAPVKTELLLTYGKNNFYAAFRAHDPEPNKVRARLRDHDSLGSDDWVGLILDTFNDERRNMQFLATALGVQTDGIGSPSGEDYSWDGIWMSAGKITEYGFAVEIAIPFSTLRFQKKGGPQVWGLDAVRRYSRGQLHHIGLFPRDPNNNCYMCQAVKIMGFEGATPGRNIEINPTLTGVRTDSRTDFPAGDLEKANQEADFGITGRLGITPSISLSGTINPDFSQVEADALQLDINEPFALYYEERRPFFTEGRHHFDTRFNAVYTRTLREPVWGLKLTGEEGGNSFGAYVVRDELTNLIFPGSQSSDVTSLDLRSTAFVARYNRDIWKNSSVGILFTDREGDDYLNRVYGVDANFRITSKDRITLQWLGSSTRYPDQVASDFSQPEGIFNSSALDVRYERSTKHHYFLGGYQGIGKDFRADLGFMPRVDIQNPYFLTTYQWYGKEKSWWRDLEVGVLLDYYEDQKGKFLHREFRYLFRYSGILQSFVGFDGFADQTFYNGKKFNVEHYTVWASSQPTADLSFGFYSFLGDRIDYANTRLGKRTQINPYVNYSFGRHLRMSFDHIFERMNVEGEHLYTANITQVTFIFQLSTRLFFRSVLHYLDYKYNPDNYTFEIDPEYKSFFTQLLFSYKINPRTVLFIGYTDNYYGDQGIRLTQADRTFFIKIGYAWVL
jgi:hypothetical protein